MPPRAPPKPLSEHSQIPRLMAQAEALRRAGRIAEAIQPLGQVALLRPNDAKALFNLGLSCLEAGQLTAAVAAFKRALALRPQYADAAWRLGVAHAKMGDTNAALDDLQQALTIKPSLAEARFLLANLLPRLGRIQEAATAFRKVRSSLGNTSLGRLAEARALELEGDDAGVERVARRSVMLEPNNALFQQMLGGVHADAGRFDEAAQCFERALELNPRLVDTWYHLTYCRRLTETDRPLVERMRADATLPGLDSGVLAGLNLAIGKAMADLGDYGEAMRAFDAAEAARAPRLVFDLAKFRHRIDATIELFTAERLARAADVGSHDETPVMIVGMPRSGTTLLEQSISSHPDVTGAGELTFWTERQRLMEEASTAGFEAPFIGKAASDYLAFIRRLGPTAARITDKMPFNFLRAGLIHLAFPRATIIHCRRRPIDTALSIHQTWFDEGINMPTGGEALVGYYRAYEKLMAHWSRVLPPNRFIEVDYEALVGNPEPQVRRLISAIGLTWNDACLHPERNGRIVKTASRWQARQPIHGASVDRWLPYEPYLGSLAALVRDSPTAQEG